MSPQNVNKETVLALRKANFKKQQIPELDANLQLISGQYLPCNLQEFKNTSFFNNELSDAYLKYSTETIRPILDSF